MMHDGAQYYYATMLLCVHYAWCFPAAADEQAMIILVDA
jgi:hypothetical protein